MDAINLEIYRAMVVKYMYFKRVEFQIFKLFANKI